MSLLGRIAMYTLPTVCIGLTALVLLGPGAARPAVGVRLWGAPADGGDALALRIEGLRRLYGVDDAAKLRDLSVSVTSAGEALAPWTGATDEDGIGEALLRAPRGLRAPVMVRVAHAGRVLAEGHVPFVAPAMASRAQGAVVGTSRGPLDLHVEVTRGVLAAPFPESLRVSATAGGAPAAGVRVEATATGAELSAGTGRDSASAGPSATMGRDSASAGPSATMGRDSASAGPSARTDHATASVVTDASGVATLEIKPLAHVVELALRTDPMRAAARGVAEAGPRERSAPTQAEAISTWEGHLPVVPGAIWLAPAHPGDVRMPLRLVAPAPKPRAYLSFVGERGRTRGEVVRLDRDAAGFFSAIVERPADLRGDETVVIASDPYEQGAGTLAWPLSLPATTGTETRIQLLLDGMPAAEARERARAGRARRAGLLVLGATALAEMSLLLLRSRSARRRLEAHLAAASGSTASEASAPDRSTAPPLSGADRARLIAAARSEPVLGVVALVALVGLAFAVNAALATFH